MNPQGYQSDLAKGASTKSQPFNFITPSLSKTLLLDFGAGTVAGGAGVLAGYPLDTIRVIQQASHAKISAAGAFWKIAKTQGAAAFFRGVESPLGSVALLNALVFSCYGQFTSFQKKLLNSQQLDLWNIFIAGTLAGSIQAVVTCPFEGIKIRMQQSLETGGIQYKNTLECTKDVFRVAGYPGVFRGFVSTLLRDSYSFGVYFASYEGLKRKYSGLAPSAVVSFFAGGIGGAVGWFLCYPLDLIKTRLQSDDLHKPQYRGTAHCAIVTYREGGLRIFTRGLGATLFRSFLVDGVIFLVYDLLLERMMTPAKDSRTP